MTDSPGRDQRHRRLTAWRGATRVLSRITAEHRISGPAGRPRRRAACTTWTTASGNADEYTVGKFIADWEVARRLARARRVISVALGAQLSEEDNAEIDAMCDQGRIYGMDSTISPSADECS